jgi:hypothetical protein
MYWVFAHWLLGNAEELEEALALAAKNPSELVVRLGQFVRENKAAKLCAAGQRKLFERLAEG